MFGFVNADFEHLSKENRITYRGYYCGLCKKLAENFGSVGRLTLNFDMTFLIVFLSGYFGENDSDFFMRCPIHPIKKHLFKENRFTEYAADMNILMTYHKFCDDREDEGKTKPGFNTIEKYAEKIKCKYPVKSEKIEKALLGISQAEKCDEHNPDIPADFFGEIMGEIFDYEEKKGELYSFGYALGKVIYVMDACVDLKQDIKKLRYNPMVEISSADFQQILTILLCDCTDIYDKMEFTGNREIIDNILFSGIWTKYRRKFS